MASKKDFSTAGNITAAFLQDAEKEAAGRETAATIREKIRGNAQDKRETPERIIAKQKEEPERPNIERIKIKVNEKPEYKTRRLQLLIKPSLHEKLKTTSKEKNVSVNDLINQILEAAYSEGVE